MVGGKKNAVVVVVLMAAMVVSLQLMEAPTAMARSLLSPEEPQPALRSAKIPIEKLILKDPFGFCAGETCFFGLCWLSGCRCQYPYCVPASGYQA